MKNEIIQISHLERAFKPKRKQTVSALHDVTLKIAEGEIVAITGVSGSGKSTLLQIIGGLDTPSRGSVTVDSINLSTLRGRKLSAFRNRTTGFVYQAFYLQPFLTLAENVAIPLMFGKVPYAARTSQVEAVIEAVGLTDRKNYLPRELSGGQIQRAAIARALVNNPKIILADEPTGNLDADNAAHIFELFTDIRRKFGTTIVIVTHDMNLARLADRTIKLVEGSITI